MVGTLRLVIEAGIRDHISRGGDRFENPANAIAKAKVPKTDLMVTHRVDSFVLPNFRFTGDGARPIVDAASP